MAATPKAAHKAAWRSASATTTWCSASPEDASEADVKRAFRELARKHHPDVNPDDGGEAFREINEAYAVLSDRDSRARYDRWGHGDDDVERARRGRRCGAGDVQRDPAAPARQAEGRRHALHARGHVRGGRVRHREDDHDSAAGPATRAEAARHQDRRADRHEGRHDEGREGRGRARQGRRAAGRSPRDHPRRRACDVPPRRARRAQRSHDHVHAGRARRGARSADARRRRQDADPRGHAARARVPDPRPRHPAGLGQERAARRSSGPRPGRGADRADARSSAS